MSENGVESVADVESVSAPVPGPILSKILEDLGAAGQALLVSSPGTYLGNPGWLSICPYEVEVLTWARCLGFALSPGKDRIALAAIGPGSMQPTGLHIYDRSGLVMYRRLDAVKDPHDLRWSKAGIEVVSAGTNEIVTVDEAGEVVSAWTPVPGLVGDCWHLNCSSEAQGRHYVSAFGDFRVSRAWNHPLEKARGRGFLYDMEKGEPLIRGLTAPHTPLWTGRCWLVCDSGVGDLVEFDADGLELRRKHIADWTRGMILGEEWLLVGSTSSTSEDSEENSSALFLLDRQDWQVIEQLDLAGYEPYTLALVPSDLLTGLRLGVTGSSLDTGPSPCRVEPSVKSGLRQAPLPAPAGSRRRTGSATRRNGR